MGQRLPVFPLGTVLFPGLVLPLHIFEDRYRELVRHLTSLPEGVTREFGVVAIRRGWEVLPSAGPPTAPAPTAVSLHEVGCTAELRQVTELPNGRFDIVTVGRRRFRITDLVDEPTPYLSAAVEWLPEPVGQEELADRLAPQVLAVFRQYLELVRTDSADITEQLPEQPTVLSHLVAATTALTITERQALLAEPDTARRLRTELRMLNREVSLLRRVRAVPVPLPELAVPASSN
ncbi:LON peptidase substrate-binding domain-containing protein [Solwaraspora sp. WMMB335]|uniref:LON peptidase substrate-binding domain-containing protein n=1 Tax=Solwaraspora sp. WMMB335 TaxID=3404118 RepID=UPI003B93B2EA